MKQLIFGFAILILWTSFSVFQVDSNRLIRMQEDLKFQADECANAAAFNIDGDEYAQGKLVFSPDNANEDIENMLKVNLNLDSNLEPLSDSYWEEGFDYYSYYIDDSQMLRKYKNGVFEDEYIFEYGNMFVEPITNYHKLITKPTVIVTLDSGKPYFRLSFLEPSNAVRTSAYEYLN